MVPVPPVTTPPKRAMVLAAGLGTRMRPFNGRIPKPLVSVGGKALIDYVLDRLAEQDVERAVVNVHHLADQIEHHLAQRGRPDIVISDERDELLGTGGGVLKALPLLGEDPFFVANIDSLWVEGERPALETLKAAWDPAAMDLCLLLVPRGYGIGFEGPQGFFRDETGRLTHSTAPEPPTPFANIGFGIMKPQILDGEGGGAFSIVPVWHRLQMRGRLFGAVMDGYWMHVGDPAAREAAEARLT